MLHAHEIYMTPNPPGKGQEEPTGVRMSMTHFSDGWETKK